MRLVRIKTSICSVYNFLRGNTAYAPCSLLHCYFCLRKTGIFDDVELIAYISWLP